MHLYWRDWLQVIMSCSPLQSFKSPASGRPKGSAEAQSCAACTNWLSFTPSRWAARTRRRFPSAAGGLRSGSVAERMTARTPPEAGQRLKPTAADSMRFAGAAADGCGRPSSGELGRSPGNVARARQMTQQARARHRIEQDIELPSFGAHGPVLKKPHPRRLRQELPWQKVRILVA